MAKGKDQKAANPQLAEFLADRPPSWQPFEEAIALRFNQEYRKESFELPAEVESMPIAQEWIAGLLTSKIASPFWEVAKPKKQQRCLDLGCGFSFLIYPWREWDAFFYGQEISSVARDFLTARGSQLNSKLFKGVKLGGAHELDYPPNSFDLAIATGFSCYYPLSYWEDVLRAVKPVLKSDGFFVFDAIDPETELAENWAILETYLGAEVFLEPLSRWEALIKAAGAQIVKKQPGELFQLYKVKF
ncbi:class I SAM-dependent methyltransferase [Phormidium tenue FACHB-886]|nr:class I SAM-dependent methyltransferase [Phormidium tenue FACHB-886]